MTLAEFLNAAKILRTLDRDTLVNAGALPCDGWLAFRSNPLAWLTQRATDFQAEALWRLVEARLPKPTFMEER